MVVPALRLEAQPKRRSARPAVVAPRAAAADARAITGSILHRGRLGCIQIRIDPAGNFA
jgi:hypothetical protein